MSKYCYQGTAINVFSTILLQGNIFCCQLNCADMFEHFMEQPRK